jgi:hypothetical protein
MICRLRPFADNPPVCCPRARYGHSVYRWRRDRICPHAFNPIHSCRNRVRIAIISKLVEKVDHPNLAPPPHHVVSVPCTCTAGIPSERTYLTGLRQHLVSRIMHLAAECSTSGPNGLSQALPHYYSYPHSRDMPRVRSRRCLLSRRR